MQATNSRFNQPELQATSVEEMAAFDALPRDIREFLNGAAVCWSAVQLARAPTGAPRRMGAITISAPDQRGALLDAMRRQEAALGLTPLVARPRCR